MLEEFTCMVYSHICMTNGDEVRALMLKKMVGDEEKLNRNSKVELSHLPPCRDSLIPHIDRVNNRVGQWKRSHIPIYELSKAKDRRG